MGKMKKNRVKIDQDSGPTGDSDQICDAELSRLEAELMSFSKSCLDAPDKKNMKKHLISRIHSQSRAEQSELHKSETEILSFGLEKLIKAIKRFSSSVETPKWASVMMKERILDYAEGTSSRKYFGVIGNFVEPFKRLAASVLLVVFALTAVLVIPYKLPVTFAKATFLADVSGEVYVKRKVELIEAEVDMELIEGDVVVTKGDSAATIQFLMIA